MRISRLLGFVASASVVVFGVASGCSDADTNCRLNVNCPEDSICAPGYTSFPKCCDDPNYADPTHCDNLGGSGGTGASGPTGGGGTAGDGGTGGGGSAPCGDACGGDTPHCDETSMECVACLGDGDCDDPAAAKCDAGSCVACDDSAQCTGVTGTEVCEAGTCVECTVDDASACDDTCDLLALECVDVAAGSVGNCKACSNDDQCGAGHRCIPLDFEGSAHGHYCLAEPDPTCARPFQKAVNKASVNGVAATDYCGIEEDLATCEAVLALVQGWFCTGTDGMCSEMEGGTEMAVPGAVCQPVDLGGDACTYGCNGVQQCPLAIDSCGDGDETPPGWCGG